MDYTVDATSDTPAYIIYLIDASGSMEAPMPGTSQRKIDVVTDMLAEIARIMFYRSKKGRTIAPRYRMAVYAYGSEVTSDTNDEFIPVSKFIERIPEFSSLNRAMTNTKGAFERALHLLEKKLPDMQNSPAPMICHLTDGEYSKEYGDPAPIARRIMSLRNPDGNVLIENIFLGEGLLVDPITNTTEWEGVKNKGQLSNNYAKFLYSISSKWPKPYTEKIKAAHGYNIASGTRMFFPAQDVDTVKMAFVASGVTGTRGSSAYLEWSEETDNISRTELLTKARFRRVINNATASRVRYNQTSSTEQNRQEFSTPFFAIARANLDKDDIAYVGKVYSVKAGIAGEKQTEYKSEAFDLPLHREIEHIEFDIILHPQENVLLISEWQQHLVYSPLNPNPQLVTFTFRAIKSGHSSFVVDFYHEQRWLKTIRFHFRAIESHR